VKIRLPKLSSPRWRQPPQPHEYGDLWYREQTTGPMRLVIGPSRDHINLILALLDLLPGPFGVLYVLLTPRREERPPGRYAAADISPAAVRGFLETYRTFFEQDGRHHVWVESFSGPGLLVYDQHNVIYAYGPLDEFEATLRLRGFTQQEFRFPCPHAHHYHASLDEDEAAVMSYWPWHHSPLQPDDEL
jgi:hypothetical protein